MALEYPEGFKVTKLNPSTKGKNKRGLCLHKASVRRTKRAKKQYVPGDVPKVKTSIPKRRWV